MFVLYTETRIVDFIVRNLSEIQSWKIEPWGDKWLVCLLAYFFIMTWKFRRR